MCESFVSLNTQQLRYRYELISLFKQGIDYGRKSLDRNTGIRPAGAVLGPITIMKLDDAAFAASIVNSVNYGFSITFGGWLSKTQKVMLVIR